MAGRRIALVTFAALAVPSRFLTVEAKVHAKVDVLPCVQSESGGVTLAGWF